MTSQNTSSPPSNQQHTSQAEAHDQGGGGSE